MNLRRRRGSTSPPLIGIEPNPGPKTGAKRRVAKQPQSIGGRYLSEEKKQQINEQLAQGLSQRQIAKNVGCKEEAVRRRVPTKHKRKVDAESPVLEDPHKVPKLSDKERGKMEYGFQVGDSVSAIAAVTDRSKATVYRNRSRFEEQGTLDRKHGSGRPRVTTASWDRAIVRAGVKDRYATCSALANAHPTENNHIASHKTVIRRLGAAGFRRCIAAKKPLLRAKNIKFRLQWAKDHEHWTVDDWSHVLWSDEAGFELFTRRKGQRVTRKEGERFNAACMVPTVKKGGGKINVWGCFSAKGMGPMKKIEGIMDRHVYHNILVGTTVPELKRLVNEDRLKTIWYFQSDNDPKHTAELNRLYIESKVKEFDGRLAVITWPSQSPDLNPIENLWDYIKGKISRRKRKPCSLTELFQFIQEEWNKIDDNYIQSLIQSMPTRIAEVIKARGGHTSY